MALTVETGAVVAGANSYVSVADADAYHTLMGNSAWTGDAAVKEAAILRAMRYIDSRNWKGAKTAYANPLAWPRSGVVDGEGFDVPTNAVPPQVIVALCEAALREVRKAGTLEPDMAHGGRITSQSVEGISQSFAPGSPAETAFLAITNALRGLVKGSINFEIGRG